MKSPNFDPNMLFRNTDHAIQLILAQEWTLDALMAVVRCNCINEEYGFAAELIRLYGKLE